MEIAYHQKGLWFAVPEGMEHQLPDLPFPRNALEPLMSAETLDYHHGKHHAGYVKKLNRLIKDTEFENLPLDEIVLRSSGSIYNNAAQAWNHSFFWHSLSPERSRPSGRLLTAIQRDFGGVDGFLEAFRKKGMGLFGSGYVWLTESEADGRLSIETMANAKNPLQAGKKPLVTCDLWEHAYYIDYRNERSRFLDGFVQLMNWEFAASNFEAGRVLAA